MATFYTAPENPASILRGRRDPPHGAQYIFFKPAI
jgi:hypothetical protein